MITKWWFSSKIITVLVTENDNIIVRTAPVTGKFIGQPISNLEYWMTKQGKFRKSILSNNKENEMVPPKKSPPNVAPKESVFAAMKKQGALAKNMAKAKKVVAVREFDGPDGDYISNLNRVSHYTKDGSLGIVLEFRATEDGETQGQKLVVFFSFKTTDYETVQEVQNRFFETLQLMGLETDIDDKELEVALDTLITSKTEITLRVKTSKRGGKFINVVGLASAANEVENTEYVEEKEEVVDDWPEEDEEITEDEEVTEDEQDHTDISLPSFWVGYAMLYKEKEVEVLTGDDKTKKCTIKAGTKKLIVPFSALSQPTE